MGTVGRRGNLGQQQQQHSRLSICQTNRKTLTMIKETYAVIMLAIVLVVIYPIPSEAQKAYIRQEYGYCAGDAILNAEYESWDDANTREECLGWCEEKISKSSKTYLACEYDSNAYECNLYEGDEGDVTGSGDWNVYVRPECWVYTSVQPTCPEGQFLCELGPFNEESCINPDWVCDGAGDCFGGFDELNCN